MYNIYNLSVKIIKVIYEKVKNMNSQNKKILTIYGNSFKQIATGFGGLLFVVVGFLMLVLPPPDYMSIWSTPLGKVILPVFGVAAVVFGILVIGVMIFVAIRPILLLYPDKIYDSRRKLEIPFDDIKEMKDVSDKEFLGRQWICLYMHDALKYKELEKMSKDMEKKLGIIEIPDLTLDLTLASKKNFGNAKRYISEQIKQSQEV